MDGASGSASEEEAHEEQERRAFEKVVQAMLNYEADVLPEIERWERNFKRLPSKQQHLLHSERVKFVAARQCVHANARSLHAILGAFDSSAAPAHLRVDLGESETCGQPNDPQDAEKVRYLLKNLARDWSTEGRAERMETYDVMLDELERLIPPAKWPMEQENAYSSNGATATGDLGTSSPPNVLIPGAGLGRMCLDVVQRGYTAQGNEFSYFMLLPSSFMLNQSSPQEPLAIHPWVHSSMNHLCDADMLRELHCPDVDPVEQASGSPGSMSMCAGDFLEVYSKTENIMQWDAILACFFLDTAQNFIDYLETMYNALAPGGIVIHFGPLLFHWAEHGNSTETEELSVEVSWATVKAVAQQLGFELQREELRACTYTTNRHSMMQTVYNAVFATFVKPRNAPATISRADDVHHIQSSADAATSHR